MAGISSYMFAALGNRHETNKHSLWVTFILLTYVFFFLFKMENCDMPFEPRGMRNRYSTPVSAGARVTRERVPDLASSCGKPWRLEI